MSKKQSAYVTARLSAELKTLLANEARKQERTESFIARKAIEAYFRKAVRP